MLELNATQKVYDDKYSIVTNICTFNFRWSLQGQKPFVANENGTENVSAIFLNQPYICFSFFIFYLCVGFMLITRTAVESSHTGS